MWPQIIFAVVTMIVSVAVSLMMLGTRRQDSGEVEAPSVEYGTPIKVVLGSRDVAPTYTYFGDQKGGGSEKMKIYIDIFGLRSIAEKRALSPF
jgi:hypothetical protein